jgi:hypothetical protein
VPLKLLGGDVQPNDDLGGSASACHPHTLGYRPDYLSS